MNLIRKFLWAVTGLLIVVSANANFDFAPPKVLLVDEFGVNLYSGQVTARLDTVAIGGEVGLSHDISAYTNDFSMIGYYGYQDKYYAKSRATDIETRPGRTPLMVLRIHDFADSADFKVMVNGQAVANATNPTSNYTYEALGDARHSLSVTSDGGLRWTKPDGTVVNFYRASSAAWATAIMTEIIHPNGFTIFIDRTLKNVATNTGFALKYIYVPDDRGMDPVKPSLPTTQIPPVAPGTWSGRNPKYIQAINASLENCLSSATPCAQKWPQATFTWPGGMPRAIYLGDSTFTVEDATGGKTDFFFRGYDLAYDGNVRVDGYVANERFSPRLVGIKPAYSAERSLTYTYRTVFGTIGGADQYSFYLAQTAGVVTTATKIGRNVNYQIGQAYNGDVENVGEGIVRRVRPSSQLPGVLVQVITSEGTYTYEHSYRNFPVSFRKVSGELENYRYDSRGNLSRVDRNGTWMTAEYPTTCSEATKKYCNKPTWTSDAKGNRTTYTYHAESGQISTVTYPADKNGKRRVIRYEYAQMQAYYYDANGNRVYGSPMWLKTAERTCTNSNTLNNVCENSSDEVTAQFQYASDNLYLTGITDRGLSASTLIGGPYEFMSTKQTCFQYDRFGNRVGVTGPTVVTINTPCPRQ